MNTWLKNNEPMNVGDKRENISFGTYLTHRRGVQVYCFYAKHINQEKLNFCVVNSESFPDDRSVLIKLCDMPRKSQKKMGEIDCKIENNLAKLFEIYENGTHDELADFIGGLL